MSAKKMSAFISFKVSDENENVNQAGKVRTHYKHLQSVELSQQQILGTGNLPQGSAPVCINIDISPEMAAQSAQRNQAFCVTASDWSPIRPTSA